LLGSPAMQEVIRRLAGRADIVILDSPPVLPVADSVILAARATATLLVVQAGRTSVRSAQLAHEALARAQARPLGIVLNRATESLRGYYRSATRRERPPARPRHLHAGGHLAAAGTAGALGRAGRGETVSA
jgi:Mrp family chromosome partitioning ATPase